jgi:hypothetical protein
MDQEILENLSEFKVNADQIAWIDGESFEEAQKYSFLFESLTGISKGIFDPKNISWVEGWTPDGEEYLAEVTFSFHEQTNQIKLICDVCFDESFIVKINEAIEKHTDKSERFYIIDSENEDVVIAFIDQKTKNTLEEEGFILDYNMNYIMSHETEGFESKRIAAGPKLLFDEQLKVFNSLGYHLNEGITKELIFEEMKGSYLPGEDIESVFRISRFQKLYYYLGSHSGAMKYYSNKAILFDLEFIDSNSDYVSFMNRMGDISNGEIVFSNIIITTDADDYEWIEFKVNNMEEKWKLEKRGHVSDSFFQRFSYLPLRFNTKGRYTYYDDGGQQFVIDYATAEEQVQFIKITGLKREWLGEGNHFSDPKD